MSSIRSSSARLAAVAATGALAAGLTLPSAHAAQSKSAAPIVGPSGQAFYTPPSPLPAGSHGDLVWYRPATLNLGSGAPAVHAWTVLYRSQSVGSTNDVVSGTIIVPTSPWVSLSPRPVVLYAAGTQGLSQNSAPSEQLVAGSEYEASNVVAALNKGWAVEETDYEGYLNGGVPDYIVGQSEGHAVLDIFKAGTEIPGSGLSSSAQVATWGYSQGGGASAWAAQEAPTYTPTMKLVGDASGGIPSDLVAVANNLNGGLGAGFLLYAVIGLNQDYPSQINLPSYSSSAGVAAEKEAEGQNFVQSLFSFAFQNIDSYTVNDPANNSPWTLSELLSVPSIASVVAAQSLGTVALKVPVFQYHAGIDEIVPLAQDQALNKTWCGLGMKVQFNQYPGEHLLADYQATGDVVTWIGNRFGGQAAPSNC